MSKNDMVMVPRTDLQRLQENMDPHRGAVAWGIVCDLLERPAVQHQGEPVALPERLDPPKNGESHQLLPRYLVWNACLDEIAKLGPLFTHPAPAVQQEPVAWLDPSRGLTWLANRMDFAPGSKFYTHADPAEVERLRNCLRTEVEAGDSWKREAEALRAQLAEAHALLRDIKQHGIGSITIDGKSILERIDAELSASAEPSAMAERIKSAACPECASKPCMCAELSAQKCDTCKGTGMVYDGEITGVGGVEFENGPVECIKDCPDCKQSAPVEIDERAEFETYAVTSTWLGLGLEEEMARDGDGYAETEVHTAWDAWQARAAMAHKP